jgi:hypothetical protein
VTSEADIIKRPVNGVLADILAFNLENIKFGS